MEYAIKRIMESLKTSKNIFYSSARLCCVDVYLITYSQSALHWPAFVHPPQSLRAKGHMHI